MKHALPFLILLSLGGGTVASADDGPDVAFLDRKAGREAIADESAEPYFRLLHPMEMQAKTGSAVPGETLEAQQAVCRERYQDAVGEFTEQEQEAIRWYVERYHEMVAETYPRYAQTPWRFLKLSPPAEAGLPHTRGPCIVLPPVIVSILVAAKERKPDGALAREGVVLLHEQMHVVQRANRERVERFYRETWNLLRPDVIERCAWLEKHQVVNPDSVDTRWVFAFEDDGEQRWIQPEVILSMGEGPKGMPRDLRMVALELEKTARGFAVKTQAGGMPVYASLVGFEPYLEAFPGTHAPYHPNETMADLFTNVVVHDHVLGREPGARPELQRYRKEFRALLAE